MTTICKICSSESIALGTKQGKVTERIFHLRRCENCDFAFVSDPWTDYKAIYSEDYYRGQGADPYIDYVYESEHFQTTIRAYEWQGILKNIKALVPIQSNTRWLDFGCGQGSLLQYCNQRLPALYFGFEEGWCNPDLANKAFTLIQDINQLARLAPFDVITAVEVFEHIENPDEVAILLRKLLRPGGLLFLTTGNPEPHWQRFLQWDYVYPEIHLSYFSPKAINRLLTEAGFRTEFRGYLPGFSDIIRYKVLKKLGIKTQHLWEKSLPWPLIAKAIDYKLKITDYPVAWSA